MASARINFVEGGLHFERIATSTNFQCGESKIVDGIPLMTNKGTVFYTVFHTARTGGWRLGDEV